MKKALMILLVGILVLFIGCQTTQTATTNTQNNDVTKENISEAVKRYDFAKEYLKNKQYDSAIKNFNAAIADSNDYLEAYIGLGKAFEGKMYYDKAESLYTVIQKKFNTNPAGYVAMGYLYTKLRKYNDAETIFRQALDIDSTHAGAWFGLGKLLEKKMKGDKGKEEAIKCYENACNYNPDDLTISYEYGKALLALEKYKKAQEFLEKVVQDHPNIVGPISNLAEAYLESKEYTKAVSAYKRTLELDSTKIDAYLGLARSYQALKQYSNAEQQYLKIIKLKPTSTIPYLYLGQMYMNIKNYNKAINYLNKALAKNPKDSRALLLMGQCYFLKADPKKVKTDADRAKAYANLDKAKEYFNRIIQNNLKYVSEAKKGLQNIKQRKKQLDPTRW